MNDKGAIQLLGPLKYNLDLSSLGDFPVGPTVLGAQAFTRYIAMGKTLSPTLALVFPGQQQPGLQQLATFIFKEMMVSTKLYLAPCILETIIIAT